MTRSPHDPNPEKAQDTSSTVDASEIRKFEAIAAEWWDPEGKFRPLHQLNPLRMAFIRDQILAARGREDYAGDLRPLEGLRIVDVGCGGGLLCEPLARLGAKVTGLDASHRNIEIARIHAAASNLAIDYRAESAEVFLEKGQRFDAVLAMEVVEHVADLPAFLDASVALMEPDGLFFGATLNRTLKSLLLAKIGAEYLLRWLPVGTHDWRRFLKPSEFLRELRALGLECRALAGTRYDPLTGTWQPTEDLSVNYAICAQKSHG
jgi:2-polyprenyl-6-hydroxyphenyl methylase/3-demethylubiquinone-9 3-methyltransferase